MKLLNNLQNQGWDSLGHIAPATLLERVPQLRHHHSEAQPEGLPYELGLPSALPSYECCDSQFACLKNRWDGLTEGVGELYFYDASSPSFFRGL